MASMNTTADGSPAGHTFIQTKVITTATGARKRVKVKNTLQAKDNSSMVPNSKATAIVTNLDTADGKPGFDAPQSTPTNTGVFSGTEPSKSPLSVTFAGNLAETNANAAQQKVDQTCVGEDSGHGDVEDVNGKKLFDDVDIKLCGEKIKE